jgi:hypothetical protein
MVIRCKHVSLDALLVVFLAVNISVCDSDSTGFKTMAEQISKLQFLVMRLRSEMKADLKSATEVLSSATEILSSKIEILLAETAGLNKKLDCISNTLAGFPSLWKSNVVVEVWPSHRGNDRAQVTLVNTSFLSNG